MRELSASRPDSYTFVGYYFAMSWERARQRAFRGQAGATGKPFRVFRHIPADRDDHPSRSIRLAAWLATLPHHCAVMAENDQIAADVAAATDRLHECWLLGCDFRVQGLRLEIAYHPERSLDKSGKPVLHYHVYGQPGFRHGKARRLSPSSRGFGKYLKFMKGMATP